MRAKHVTPIEDKTAGVLTAELARAGAGLMLEVLEDLDAQPPVPQPEEGVTYAAKIDKAEARIDFTHDANFIERQIRALNPVPGAFFEYHGERFRVHAAHIEHASGTPGELIDDSLLIRSEEHTSELQSLMRISYAVFCLKKKTHHIQEYENIQP